MKKNIILSSLFYVVCLLVFSFLGCTEPKVHVHTYLCEYSDMNYHTYTCTCGHNVVKEKSLHNFVACEDKTGYEKCSECGLAVLTYDFATFINECKSKGVYKICPKEDCSVPYMSLQFGKRVNSNTYYVYYINNIKFTGSSSSSSCFYSDSYLESIDLSGVNFSGLTDMSYLFSYIKDGVIQNDKLTVDSRNATNMKCMFESCKCIDAFDLTLFDTSKVENMSLMFAGSNVENIDISNFDTSNVTDMSDMFCNMPNLKSVSMKNLNTFKVTTMSDMFYKSSVLETVDMAGCSTSNVTDANGMFAYCAALKSADLRNFDTSLFTGYTYNYGLDNFPTFILSNHPSGSTVGTSDSPAVIYVGENWKLNKDDVDYYFDYYGHTAGTEDDYSGTYIYDIHLHFIDVSSENTESL